MNNITKRDLFAAALLGGELAQEEQTIVANDRYRDAVFTEADKWVAESDLRDTEDVGLLSAWPLNTAVVGYGYGEGGKTKDEFPEEIQISANWDTLTEAYVRKDLILAPGWISVDDRLPEGNFPTFSDTVPARGDDSSNEWFPAYYVFTRDEWLDCDDSEISVTHWYDLPDLPEVTP